MYPSSINNEPCKVLRGSSSSSPTPLPSAPPQFPDHDDNHFNYPSSPPPAATITTGIPVSSSTALDEQDPRLHSPVPWSSGLCDCCDDISTCCLTCWCPCVTFGRIAEIVDRGSTSCGVSAMLYTMILCLTGCSCLYSCFFRSKLRGQYFLEENPCTDCCIHCCCEECSLCQEYRELKNRGFDMSIGWHGNMERRKHGVPVAPIVQGGMRRS